MVAFLKTNNNYRWSKPEDHPLRVYVKRMGIKEAHAMNALQNHGVISDNAITFCDVGNYAHAMIWLHQNLCRLKQCRE